MRVSIPMGLEFPEISNFRLRRIFYQLFACGANKSSTEMYSIAPQAKFLQLYAPQAKKFLMRGDFLRITHPPRSGRGGELLKNNHI